MACGGRNWVEMLGDFLEGLIAMMAPDPTPRCSVCATALTNWYFERDDRAYCKDDFREKFGDTCNSCFSAVTGPIMVAGEHRYHPECFKCCQCATYIGDGETYALLQRAKLFCGQCYTAKLKALPEEETSSPQSPSHTIYLVEIPPLGGTRLAIRRSSIRGHIILTRCDRMVDLVKVGDKILEINGISVREKCTSEIEESLVSQDKVLLTVERDPNTNMTLSTPERSRPVTMLNTDSIRRKTQEPRSSSLPRDNSFNRSPSRSPTPSLSRGMNAGSNVDLRRSQSFREAPNHHKAFRMNDLVIGAKLGEGSFGAAYKVTHKNGGEVMVLKKLTTSTEESKKNFKKEVKVLKNLDHPNVLRFIGVVFMEDKTCLLTEFISGGTLGQRLLDLSREIPWLERYRYARDIACGMEYLHSKEVIHRDLNSENCFVKEDNTVVVGDFGLVKVMKDTLEKEKWEKEVRSQSAECNLVSTDGRKQHKKERRRKRYTVQVGNAFWMAPEMRCEEPYNERVDIYSFGIIACEIISRISADPEIMTRYDNAFFNLDIEAFRKENLPKDCPPPLFKIAVMCCDPVPEKRPLFDQLHDWLQSLILHLDSGAAIPSPLRGDISSIIDDIKAISKKKKEKRASPKSNTKPPVVDPSSSSSTSDSSVNSFDATTSSQIQNGDKIQNGGAIPNGLSHSESIANGLACPKDCLSRGKSVHAGVNLNTLSDSLESSDVNKTG